MPRSIDLARLSSRADTLDHLGEVKRMLAQLLEKVGDTEVRLGAEVYGVARTVYAVMKTPATMPGLKDRQTLLATRFSRKNKSRQTEETAAVKTTG